MTDQLEVVAEPEDLTPEWLTRALGSTGEFAGRGSSLFAA